MLSVVKRGSIISSVCVTVAILLGCGSAYAQEDVWNGFNDQVFALYHQGNYAQAVEVGQKALDIAKDTFGLEHENTAQAMSTLGMLYYANGDYAQAEPF